jgi:hypothetical protein
MLIVNTEKHTDTALMVEPFGTDGALRFVPMDGDTPGRAFILDAASVRHLHTATAPADPFLSTLAAQHPATEAREAS